MHQGVIKVSHTFLYGIEITVLKTVMTKDESENIDTSHSKNSDSMQND